MRESPIVKDKEKLDKKLLNFLLKGKISSKVITKHFNITNL
jgi:hypothetical protein